MSLSRQRKRRTKCVRNTLRYCAALALSTYIALSYGLARMHHVFILESDEANANSSQFLDKGLGRHCHSPRIIMIHDMHESLWLSLNHNKNASSGVSLSGRKVEHMGGPCRTCHQGRKPLYSDNLKVYYEECTPIAEWQTTFHPTCNALHEVPLADHHTFAQDERVSVLSMEGGIRSVWKVSQHSMGNSNRDVVMKLVHLDLDMNRVWTEHKRDAMALDQLSKSDRVVHMYAFCGQSQLTEMADDFLHDMIQKAKHGSIDRLRIALETTKALVDVHSIDYPNSTVPSLSHSDLHVDNIVQIGGKIKLNDFNRAIPLRIMKNGTHDDTNKPCGYPEVVGYHRWRSRESYGTFGYLDPAKADMYSIGNLYYYLLTSSEPWKYLEPDGYMHRSEVRHAKLTGKIVPHVPPSLQYSNNPVEQVLYSAAMACFRAIPEERPTSHEVAIGLEIALEWMTRNKNTTRNDMWNLFHKT